jgi:hypothetical protein
MRSRPQSRSCLLTTSGGASRIAVPCVSLVSTPRVASLLATSRPGSEVNSRPAHSPRPRTSRTTERGSAESRSCIRLPSTAARAWYSPVRSIAITSRATAQASGLPENVDPCWPGCSTPSTGQVEIIADSGTMPPASALPTR